MKRSDTRAVAGRTVVVTGAARGQGKIEAELFARAGAHVVVCDILDDEGTHVADELHAAGASATYRHLDVASEQDWSDLVDHLGTQPPVAALVNNAGIADRRSRVVDADLQRWRHVLDVNLIGPLLGTRALAPLLRDAGGGSITNIGSAAGMTAHFAASYSASKWALRGLTKTSALELAPWRIRVNCVHPGIVETPILAGSADFVRVMTGHTPQRRLADAAEVARAVVWLAGDEGSFITGVDLPVDGGLTQLNPYFAIADDISQNASATW